MKVSLFITCVADAMYPEVGESVVRILQRYGVDDIDFPMEQTCCGQPAFNSGYWDEARQVAKNWLDAFKDSEYIVAPSGSCVGMIVHNYLELMEDDPYYKSLAETLIPRTFEFTQFLVEVLKVTDLGATSKQRVTFHPSCHCSRFLGVVDPPKNLLENVRGIDYVELPHPDQCCGFGGTFSVKMSDLSRAMVDEKVENIEKTNAEVLVGTDLGCLMNIAGRLQRENKAIQVRHIAQFLDEGMDS
ncbi:(Fe-S)-binding protein [Alicyclobacillus fastidiosus]|uniref:(Fe-S)-binding protein n=1 Tax=Alicyclobacillus fastidiosus TaxID=392011 RepID=A0ABY6ZC61_9BACL|nr:(Fe-S)-binding protein [Alicyclobacillus fastidiosus]WAH39846.1 (Fe-S)-binding protein [Alicyclobacillus fastidiosus]GMA61102.1 Fe-S oxidoreductase [Alicyclobacillus fastidiosus]